MKKLFIISFLLLLGSYGFGQTDSTLSLKSDIPNYTDSNGLKQGIWKEEFNQDGISYFIATYGNGIKNGK